MASDPNKRHVIATLIGRKYGADEMREGSTVCIFGLYADTRISYSGFGMPREKRLC